MDILLNVPKITEFGVKTFNVIEEQTNQTVRILCTQFLARYNFDFIFKNKKILEIQGDFWHANPNIYHLDDELLKNWYAEDVWKKDKRKKEKIESLGYTVLYLWESEINKMTDDDIKRWIYDNIFN